VLSEHGRKHAGYGVIEAHYETVRTVLLWTLDRILGSEFTPEAQAAWTEAYDFIAEVMKDAAFRK
jgi:hemoglobin-like flavoprotein